MPLLQHPETKTAPTLRFRKAVTWRSLLIGTLLVPPNCYWVVQMEIIRYSAHPTTISLFFNLIFILLILSLLNVLLARIRPAWALTQGELMVIYMMLALSSCLAGHDMAQVLVPMLSWPFRFATSSNNWQNLFVNFLPKSIMVSDRDVYLGYYNGNTSFYHWQYLAGWALPILAWSAFLVALLFVMQCINTILRKQWTEREKLSYPVIQLPLVLSEDTEKGIAPPLFRNPLFWIAFAGAGMMDLLNGLNVYFPSVPRILTPGFGLSYFDLGALLPDKPWNAIGWTPISWYPFMVGFGMLLPVDFLFSCWFFYLFWKLELVFSVAMAWDKDPKFPYANDQAFGAYVAFFLFSVWLSRGYLVQVLRRAVGLPSPLDDSQEPIRYRWALLGIVGGMAFLAWFCSLLGISPLLALLAFIIYFVLGVAITRMRAELGTPVHDLHFTGPDWILTETLGTRSFSTPNLVGLSFFFWFNRAYRCHPMPHQLEAFKLAEHTHSSFRAWFWGMGLATLLGSLAAFWAMLHLNYDYGAVAKSRGSFGSEAYDRLASWLSNPQPPNFSAILAIGVGLGVASFLQYMRTRFPWWPFHPLGFAVTSSWEINLVWMPLLLAWLLKVVLLRYGGLQGFRKSLPFFFGLILGQFVIGSLGNLIGILMELPTYQFWQ